MKLFKNNQYGRSLLSKYGADEQIFSSNVYKQRKCQSDTLQYGRSMVEMLGVLAIIGVLSVGSIAGYSKAMFKYKLNKAVTQISTISQLVRNFFANQPFYDGLYTENVELLEAILSPEMVDKNSTVVSSDTSEKAYVISPFNSGILIKNDTSNRKAFTINLFGLSSHECIALATTDWSNIGAFSVHATNVIYTDTSDESDICAELSPNGVVDDESSVGCPGGKNVPIPIACNCESERSCTVLLAFE